MEPLLEVKDLDVAYGKIQVLWGVSFKVYKGEVVALVGSNGAGKTTTLKTIMGLIKPVKGAVLFEGRRIDGLPTHSIVKMGVTLVPEGRQLFPELSVYDHLIAGAYLLKDKDVIRERLEFVYDLFPVLKERRSQKAGTLSGGEQQMLAIGRALMSMPKLMMFDEPSLGLAPKLVDAILDTIARLRYEGITILLVEQNVRAALEISDRGYVIENGRIILEGKSSELLESERVKKAYLAI
ncbi:MAG: ABC transporter ATP-binding protein [Desulfurococcales archaeon ex4484_204]|nr:MAG: ABC transporter ATP-binding protein [Desulfurococcales archaeon ex4484_204]